VELPELDDGKRGAVVEFGRALYLEGHETDSTSRVRLRHAGLSPRTLTDSHLVHIRKEPAAPASPHGTSWIHSLLTGHLQNCRPVDGQLGNNVSDEPSRTWRLTQGEVLIGQTR